MVVWYGHLDIKCKGKLTRVLNKDRETTAVRLSNKYAMNTKEEGSSYNKRPSHPFHRQYKVVPEDGLQTAVKH